MMNIQDVLQLSCHIYVIIVSLKGESNMQHTLYLVQEASKTTHTHLHEEE